MPFSHILITRPREEALELAELLGTLNLSPIIMPAYDFHSSSLFPDQISKLQECLEGEPPMLVFTSPRSVKYGLGQIPPDVLQHSKIASIGPTTASGLEDAGLRVSLQPRQGHGSEDFLETLAEQDGINRSIARRVFILTAPGGRDLLQQGLASLGYEPHLLMVYGRRSAKLADLDIEAIEQAQELLAMWTSANTMYSLAQRLPAQCWSRLCRAEWLVLSERLQRVARAYSPKRIIVASGPANADLFATIQTLV